MSLARDFRGLDGTMLSGKAAHLIHANELLRTVVQRLVVLVELQQCSPHVVTP